jgi:hypothetical protein
MNNITYTDTPENVLATMIKVSRDELRLALAAAGQYTIIKSLKKSGGYRTIYIPAKPLRSVQRKIKLYLQKLWPEPFPGLYGICPGTSCPGHLRVHAADRYFFQLDLQDAFPSTKTKNLRQPLVDRLHLTTNNTRLDHKIVTLIFALTTIDGFLPQGTPTAPFLFYLALGESGLIDRLARFLEEKDITITSYIDNFIFSARHPFSTEMQKHIISIIQKVGFRINPSKTKYHDLHYDTPIISGLRVRTTDSQIILPKKEVRRIRGLLHRAQFDPALRPHVLGLVSMLKPIYHKKIPYQLINGILALKAKSP